MADENDSSSSNNDNPTPIVKQKEQEIWGVPLSTWHGLGIVAVGTISLITALKVLIPPNFTLFPNPPQQGQPFNPLNLGMQPQPQPQIQQPANGNVRRPQLDNSVEEYETFDEGVGRGQGPQNLDIGVENEGEPLANIDVYDNDGNPQNNSTNGGSEESDLIKSDDRALRTNEPIIKSNSGINVTIAPEVVNSQKRFMRPTYATSNSNTEDVSSYDSYE